MLLFTREHPPVHFHAEYQEHEAVFDIATLQLKQGYLPAPTRSRGVEWAALHRETPQPGRRFATAAPGPKSPRWNKPMIGPRIP